MILMIIKNNNIDNDKSNNDEHINNNNDKDNNGAVVKRVAGVQLAPVRNWHQWSEMKRKGIQSGQWPATT